MSAKQHESVLHQIGFDPSVSSPAPAHQGAHRGYFDDAVTKHLLRLSDEEVLLNTYGSKELGQFPIKMPFVHNEDYDQCLMPFVPQHHTYYRNQLMLHEQSMDPSHRFDHGSMEHLLRNSCQCTETG